MATARTAAGISRDTRLGLSAALSIDCEVISNLNLPAYETISEEAERGKHFFHVTFCLRQYCRARPV
jgi:hypothetical protein